MTDNIIELPNADLAIRALHSEIEKLATHAAASYQPRAPLGTETNGSGDEMLMFYDYHHIKIFTCDGGVFISGIEHGGYWPDWFALRRNEARRIAQALLAAAAHASTTPLPPCNCGPDDCGMYENCRAGIEP